ncbi:MAG: SLC13 family permease [Peptococcaceae bacterium]|nr:SLC13 family permease [Peptococcaceae bacterium]
MNICANKKKIISWFITCLIPLFLLLIPCTETYSLAIKKFCAITLFFIIALAFDLLDAYIVGIGMPLLYILTGVCNYATAFSGWTNSTTMLVLTSFIFANALDRIGLLKRLGLSLVLKLGGSFDRTMWALLFTGMIITFITFCNCYIINIALGYAIYKSFDLKPTDRESVVVLLVTIASGCTSQLFSYNVLLASVLQSSVQTVIPQYSFRWYEICLYNLPIMLFSILLVFFALKWAKRKNSQALDIHASKLYCQKAYISLGSISTAEKKAVVILILIMLYLFTQPLHKLDIAYAFMLGSIICFLPFIKIGDFQDLSRVPWGTMFLVFAFLGIGSAATATGFTEILSQNLSPLISHAGMTGSVYITFLFGVLANLILSPFAMCSMLTIPIAQYCADLEFNILPHLLALYQSCDVIFLPYEWPAYLIAFSFGFVNMSTMIKTISIKAIFEIIFICIIVIPLWHIIGLIY